MKTLQRRTIVGICAAAVCCSINIGQAAPKSDKQDTAEVKEIKAVVNRFWSSVAAFRRGSADTGALKSTLAWPLMLMPTDADGSPRTEVYRDAAAFDKMVAEEHRMAVQVEEDIAKEPSHNQTMIDELREMKREQQSEKFTASHLQVTIVGVGVAQVTSDVSYKHKNPRFGAPHYLYDTVKLLTILRRQQPREIRSQFPGKWKIVFSGLPR